MFHVKRFDPGADGKREVAPPKKRGTKRKVRSGNDKADSGVGAGAPRPGSVNKDDDDVDASTRQQKHDDGDSSSAPTSSDSDSSSVPSSSDDEDESSNPTHSTTLRVIAPSQPTLEGSRERGKARGAAEDEAIDDFDADFDVIERGSHTAPSKTDDEPTALTGRDSAANQALHLSKLPIAEVASRWNLPPFLIRNLQAGSYTSFFPIVSNRLLVKT